MTMAIDSRQQHHLGALGAGGGGYDQLRYTAPFQHSWAPPPQQLYHTSPSAVDHTQTSRAPSVMSMGYVANPAASSLGPELVPTRPYNAAAFATSAPTSQPTYAHSSMPRYSPEQAPAVSPYGYDADMSRRSSYGAPTHGAPAVTRGATFDEMAGARGILAMSHDITPRPIYNTNGRDPADSYGFPPTHSPHGSVSSASTYPYYSGGSSYGSYAGSVDGSSVTDYSSASEDQMVPRTTLPGTNQLVSGFPPEPASMMTQFNSKMSPSAQKKHKCRICDKRFTRPSSLQTHMYSHTGEKPFACDHEGCGRHFSVVSNLRRHKKVHKEERKDDIDEE